MSIRILLLLTLVLASQAQIFPPSTCCSDRTITVNGDATINASPDIATLSAQVTVNAKTVDIAVKQLSSKVSQAIAVLTANGLDNSNYQTSSLNIYPNMSYPDGVPTVLGQIATQSFSITIPNIDSSGSSIGKIIDSLAAIDGIILNGLSFDIQDKTVVLGKARANAFANAQAKALDYTLALQLCLGQLVTVVDSFSSAPVTSPLAEGNILVSAIRADLTATSVNVGTIPISYFVTVIYSYG